MGRTNYFHSLPAIIFLVAIILYGMLVIEFVFVCTVCIVAAAAAWTVVLFFFKAMDWIVNFFYAARW